MTVTKVFAAKMIFDYKEKVRCSNTGHFGYAIANSSGFILIFLR